MVKRNPSLLKLHSSYLFPEIARRKEALLEKNPDAKIISLGIGDTTEPIPFSIVEGLKNGAIELGVSSSYKGYGPEQGYSILREKIAEVVYHNQLRPDEIFVSDGSKCDIGRLQLLFGSDVTMAVQDPSYPAYVDTSVACGQTGAFNQEKGLYDGIVYLNCRPENDFFPELNFQADVIYFCSPNNPTGAVATKEQLTQLVAYTKKIGAILIFDAAYAYFIQDPKLPKSIYEIEGAEEVAIELNSFSKMAGFTGVRLGWAVVPKALKYDDGTSVHQDWQRIATTFFNGASNIAQAGALKALDEEGLKEIRKQLDHYLVNAQKIKETFLRLGYRCFGGEHSPYVWVQFPGRKSWDAFSELLESKHIVTTPGSGFGPAGEGFLRFSAFAKKEAVDEAIERLSQIDVNVKR
ncbi:LL-diaminopimelate aminotransferase [Chlamydiales bacterium STE3]|nr:LL-diaminopimelate aminotransferase [Chlamydiales bacterium STE3]